MQVIQTTIMKKDLLIIVLMLLAGMQASAQGHFDVFSGTYGFSQGDTHKGGAGEANIEEMALNVRVPNKKDNGDVEVFGAMLSSLFINNENEDDVRCWSAGLNYSYLFRKGARSLQLTVIPKISSDFENSSREVLQLGSLVLATHKSSERFKYKYGLYYNRECFGHFLVPLAGFEWKPGNRWLVYATLPMNATAACKLGDRLTTGFNFTGIISSFRLRNDQYLHKSTNELSGFADFYIAQNLLLQARMGYTVGRSYRLYDSSDKIDLGISALKLGDDRKQLNDNIKDGVLLQAGLIYRVKTDN